MGSKALAQKHNDRFYSTDTPHYTRVQKDILLFGWTICYICFKGSGKIFFPNDSVVKISLNDKLHNRGGYSK